jgi:hypothetical protein
MATVTLTANTDVSALTLANDDTIDLAGFVLTFDVQPTVTGIQVTTPGTAGTCMFPVDCVIPTWDFFGGSNTSAGMINTLPTFAEIGSITGGTASNSRGVSQNNGIIGLAIGGSGGAAHGCTVNTGTIRTANGGIGANAAGIDFNHGSVHTANGGPATGSWGIRNHYGTCLRAFDFVEQALRFSRGDFKLVIGPDFQSSLEPGRDITTIYSIGPLSELATIPAGVQVITLSEGTGTAGFTGIRALSRRLGT